LRKRGALFRAQEPAAEAQSGAAGHAAGRLATTDESDTRTFADLGVQHADASEAEAREEKEEMNDIPHWMLAEFLPGNWAPDNPPEIVKNWARFRTRGGSSTSCYSLESRYRSPQHWHPTQTIVPIDMMLAVATEQAWRDIPSWKHKFLLCWHWVYAWSKGQICKSLRKHGLAVDLHEYDAVLDAAMASFHMELQKKTNETLAFHEMQAYDAVKFGNRDPGFTSARPLAGMGIPERITEAA
jgi:hypothetical protein